MAKGKYDKLITHDLHWKSDENPNLSVSGTRHLGNKWGGGHMSMDTNYVTKAHVMISQPHVHKFPQFLKVTLRIAAEVGGLEQIRAKSVPGNGRLIAGKERHVKTRILQILLNIAHVFRVLAVKRILVFHLHHQDRPAMRDLHRSHFTADFH